MLNLRYAIALTVIAGTAQCPLAQEPFQAQAPVPSGALAPEPASLISGLEIPTQTIPVGMPVTASATAQPYHGQGGQTVSPAASLNKTRVVLLKNDRCLTGRVRQLGDETVIEIDNSARIVKATSEIQTIADDMEGIYRYKVSRYPRLGPAEHIRLSRWSMVNGLLPQASQHYLAVERDVGSDEPIVKQLGIELREHLLKDEEIRAAVGLPSLAQSNHESADPVRPASSGQSEPGQPIQPAVLSAYTEHVQPILLKRCSQSGCHGLSSTNRLKFVQPVGNARARISEQNCRSVLQFVNVDDSNMSTLVRYALVAHSLQKTSGISSQETKLIETLQSWSTFARNPVVAAVEQTQVVPGSNGNNAAAAAATTPAVYNAQPKSPAASDPKALKPLGPGASQLRSVPQTNSTIIPGNGPVTRRELDELDDQVRKALGEPPRAQAKDPFDPAEFNRMRAKK